MTSASIEAIERREMADGSASTTILLAPEDNVLIARANLKHGDVLFLDGAAVALKGDAPIGFKIAKITITCGEKIIKYGAPIGSATKNIERGEVVHLTNMKSDYLPTYASEGARFTSRSTN